MQSNVAHIRRSTYTIVSASCARLNRPVAQTSGLWRFGLFVIIVVFTLTALLQSLGVPIFEGSDEQRHYAYARYLVNYRTLPPRTRQFPAQDFFSYGVEQEAGQPPLYYLPVALLTALVPAERADDVASYVVANPYVTLGDEVGLEYDNHNWFLHGTEGHWPFRDVALAVHLGRLVSIVVGVITLISVNGIARACTPDRPAVALLATALVASVPGFIYVHSVITNDVAVILFVTLSLWVAMRIARDGPRPRLALLGGLFAGLATLSKISGAWVIGIVWLALLVAGYTQRRERPFKYCLLMVGLSLAVWLLTTGWWFTFGALQNGDPLGVATHAVSVDQNSVSLSVPRYPLLLSLAIWDYTMWYATGWSNVWGPGWIYLTFHVFYTVGVLGATSALVHTLYHRRAARRITPASALQAICLLLTILLTIAGGAYWQLVNGWRLGRLLYPGLPSVAVLAAVGWTWWLGLVRLPRMFHWGLAAIVALLLQSAAVGSTVYTLTAFSPRALLSPATPGIIRTDVTFLDPADRVTPVAALTGYRIVTQDLRAPGNVLVDLCWRSLGYTKQSFPYVIELVGPDNALLGRRLSYHGLGSYPMVAWEPGAEFCDRSSLAITGTLDAPRTYDLVATLLATSPANDKIGSPAPLRAVDSAGHTAKLTLGRVRVAPVLH